MALAKKNTWFDIYKKLLKAFVKLADLTDDTFVAIKSVPKWSEKISVSIVQKAIGIVGVIIHGFELVDACKELWRQLFSPAGIRDYTIIRANLFILLSSGLGMGFAVMLLVSEFTAANIFINPMLLLPLIYISLAVTLFSKLFVAYHEYTLADPSEQAGAKREFRHAIIEVSASLLVVLGICLETFVAGVGLSPAVLVFSGIIMATINEVYHYILERRERAQEKEAEFDESPATLSPSGSYSSMMSHSATTTLASNHAQEAEAPTKQTQSTSVFSNLWNWFNSHKAVSPTETREEQQTGVSMKTPLIP